MNDGIIKENGTSRLMRASLPATYEEFRLKAAAGTQPLDIMFNADGWTQLPTFLNTANLLKAATAALYGLGSDAVPDDVFSKIFDHVDTILTIPSGTEDPAALLDNLLDEYIAKKRDKSVGFVCLATYVAHPVLAGNSYIFKVNIISQKYVSVEAASYDTANTSGAKKFTRSKYNGVWGEWRNEDRVETGRYTGTGAYGSKDPNSLTFSFKPKLFLISMDETQLLHGNSYSESGTFGYLWGALTESYKSISVGRFNLFNVKAVNKTVYWYVDSGKDAGDQLNASGTIYNYIAIG